MSKTLPATITPKRKVFKILQWDCKHAFKKGHRFNVILECGHWEELTKTELRDKKHYCFACKKNKPPDNLALEVMKDEGVKPIK